MTYNTGNPIGSNDPRDLADNAQALDRALNDPALSFTDRLGQQRMTLAGMEQAATGIPAVEASIAAQAALAGAELASEIAQLYAGIKPDTGAETLAAVTEGAYFSVPSANAAETLVLYRKVGGVAVDTGKRLPSSDAVIAAKAKADSAPVVATGGKNLLDPVQFVASKILTAAGGTYTQAAWVTSGFTPVTGNTQVSINSARFMAEYDQDMQFIAGTFWDAGTSDSAQRTFVTNAATRHLRTTHHAGGNFQVEYGATSTAFEAHFKQLTAPDGRPVVVDNTKNVHPSLVNVVADIVANKALAEATYYRQDNLTLETTDLVKTVTPGTVVGSNGALAAQAGRVTTDLITVSASTQYTVSQVRYIAYYDAAKVFISRDDLNATNYTFTTPENAAYMRVTASETALLTINQGAALQQPVEHLRAFKRGRIAGLTASLKGWMRQEAWSFTGTITRNAFGRPVTPLNIVWPDGATGALNITYNTDGTVSTMTATHIAGGIQRTLVQPAITYANGVPVTIPDITIS